jgi:putative membrane protein
MLIGIIKHDIGTFTDLDFCLCFTIMNEIHDSSTDPRIYMSAERTFLAWIRTGIAFMGFGFVVARFGLFLREIAHSNNVTVAQHDNGFSLPIGVALIVAGIMVNLIAAIRHHRYIKALDRGQFRQAYGSAFIFLIAGFLAIIGLAVAIYLAVLL